TFPERARRVEPFVPAAVAHDHARHRRWATAAVAAAFAVAGAAAYHPPVAVVAPGPVFDAGRDVTITGVPSTAPHGRYLVTTVRISRPSLLGLGAAVVRSHRRLVAVHGGSTLDQREAGEAAFRRSRLLAAAAAARARGLQVGTSPSGEVVLPFAVRFRDRPVVGPSAGLAYALAIDDMLDPTDVARGRTLAATGAIDMRGDVAAVGYVTEKAVAARADGARMLLVPDGEFTDGGGRDLAVQGVASLDEALKALEG